MLSPMVYVGPNLGLVEIPALSPDCKYHSTLHGARRVPGLFNRMSVSKDEPMSILVGSRMAVSAQRTRTITRWSDGYDLSYTIPL